MEYTANFIGNELAVHYLQQLLRQQRLPATQLWYGPEHSGKTTLVYNLTFWLLCDKRDAATGVPCLQCNNCKLLLHDHHPNVFRYSVSEGIAIQKAGIAQGIQQWQRKPLLNTNRVVIITEAEMLTEEAANALLKALEEPHPSIYFILCTSHIEKILPTIISRCAQLSFLPRATVQLIDETLFKQWVNILLQPSYSERLKIFGEAWPKLNDRQQLQHHLTALAEVGRAIILLQHNITFTQFKCADLNILANRSSVQQSLVGLNAIARASTALLRQAQPKLIIEQILLSLYYPL